MILLDTNAVIWLDRHHPRVRQLKRSVAGLFLSPVTLLELEMLAELGRIRLHEGWAEHGRWSVDDPPSAALFAAAGEESWTHDPFDRLIVAHARLRRWKLATGDQRILEQLKPSERIAL